MIIEEQMPNKPHQPHLHKAGVGNNSGLCVVALSRNLKLTTTPDRATTQSPCYVPFLFHKL